MGLGLRVKLAPLENQHLRFLARVERFSYRPSPGRKLASVRTILLVDIRLPGSDDVLADHLWKDYEAWSANLKAGDEIYFDATVTTYQKGYRNWTFEDGYKPSPRTDWTLHKIRVLHVKEKQKCS